MKAAFSLWEGSFLIFIGLWLIGVFEDVSSVIVVYQLPTSFFRVEC